MILGTGVDITEVERIRQAMARPHGRRFLQRVFTAAEIRYCESRKNQEERFAARFAAKEAAMKALGTGWRNGVTWHDLEVVRERSGKPTLRLTGVAGELAQKMGVQRAHLSLTHSEGMAVAFVVFEGDAR